MTVFTKDMALTFGQYKGRTVDEVLDMDPAWLLWADKEVSWFELDKNSARLARQAADDQNDDDDGPAGLNQWDFQ